MISRDIVYDYGIDNNLIGSEFKILRLDLSISEIRTAKVHYKKIYISLLNYLLEDLKLKSNALTIKLNNYIKILNLKNKDLIYIDKKNKKKIFKLITKKEIRRISFSNYRFRNYRYLLLIEAFYIRSIITNNVDLDLFEEACLLLNVNGEAKVIIKEFLLSIILENSVPDNFFLNVESIPGLNLKVLCKPLFNLIQYNLTYSSTPKYNIAVCATMSSGKSTFINALLGKDYIPTRNEACTSKITSISDNDHLSSLVGMYITDKYTHKCKMGIDLKTLEEWNKDESIREVLLEGNLDRISAKNRIVTIHDTPGTNYSQDHSHHDVTMDFLENNQLDMIIYLINCEHVSTTDNHIFLEKMKNVISKKEKVEIIFLVNKVDSFDHEKEDDILVFLKDIHNELVECGFKRPVVIPVSANAARLFKMGLQNQKFSKKEIFSFMSAYEMFFCGEVDLNSFSNVEVLPNTEFVTDASTIQVGDRTYSKNDIQIALRRTGVTLVESLIEKNINY